MMRVALKARQSSGNQREVPTEDQFRVSPLMRLSKWGGCMRFRERIAENSLNETGRNLNSGVG